MSDAIGARKRALRRTMRELRRSIDDPAGRSERLWEHVRAEPAVHAAHTVMAFASVAGEPDTGPFVAWCRAEGKDVVIPDSDPNAAPPPDPLAIDVTIVPGLAFTRRGERLGQGGGWYDRVLATLRADCVAIGVAFAPQVVDELPVEPHDRVLDVVITDDGPVTRRR